MRACVPTCCMPTWSTCQRVCVPTYRKRANFSFLRASVPKCHTTCQCINLACQRAKRRANFPITKWNVKFLYFFLLLCKKFYICICIVHNNCIILHFYTSRHIKEKYVEFFFFSFWLFSWEWKHENTWFLYITSNRGFRKFYTDKITKQNKEYVWVLWSFWIMISLSWRSEIVIRNLIETMFFSISYDYIFEYFNF